MKPGTRITNKRTAWFGLILLTALYPILAGSGVLIPCLSGFIRDTNGNPVAEADLDFTVSATGQRLITPGDNTDATGFYNVCVLPGIYDVSFAPPPGTRLMGRLVREVDLTDNVGRELDMVLQFGTVLSGVVSDLAGSPVGGVDVDVDAVGGGRIYTPDDDSDITTGIYRVVVPDGLYRLRFEPLPGSRLRGAEMDSVQVSGDTSVDVTLLEGVLLDGRVQTTEALGLFDVDVDLRDGLTGAKVFVANNSTDPAGEFSVAVPTGTFELRFAPPRGSRYVAEKIDGFSITGDLTQDAILEAGIVVSLAVEDTLGNPIRDVDIDVKVTSTGEKLFTPHDNTDSNGTTDLTILEGTYTLQFDPPLGTTFDRAILSGVPVLADTTITVELKEVERIFAVGRVVDGSGTGIPGIKFEAFLQPGGAEVFLPVDATDAEGFFDLSIPIGNYDVFVTPPRGTRYSGRKIENVTASNDTTWGEILLEEGLQVEVTVLTPALEPAVGADLDFVDAFTDVEVFTPHDNTDQAGLATVMVPAGVYRLVVEPPAGSAGETLTIEEFVVNADTSATLTLRTSAPGSGRMLSLFPNFPNPFNAGTTVAYSLAEPTDITVSVFDLRGRLIRVLEQGPHEPARFTTHWDGSDGSGTPVASGVYFLRLSSSRGEETRKMALLR